MENNFCIKKGYITQRPEDIRAYVDSPAAAAIYQVEVYNEAKKISSKTSINTVLDIGAGAGDKLVKLFEKGATVGLEIEPGLSMLKKKYPDRTWLESDFNNPPQGTYGTIICADVIEHLIDPDMLLEFIKKIDFEVCVVSTPDRDTLKHSPQCQTGPPTNKGHIREWSGPEFKEYISKHFDVIEQKFFSEPANYKSQTIIFKKK